jgi:hypothetical protein
MLSGFPSRFRYLDRTQVTRGDLSRMPYTFDAGEGMVIINRLPFVLSNW